MESLLERQDNEIQALKAIYGPSELRDLRETDAWRVRRAPEIVLTLTPQQGNSGPGEVHSHIDLHVVCADNYPEQVPRLVLEKSKGLSLQQVAQLQQELENLAQELKGEVMIFELAQHVQKYLLAFNKPGFQSFYEEMQARQAQQEQQKQLLRQQEQDRERQAVQEHMQRKQQALKEEQRRRRERQSSISDDISLHHISNQIAPQEIQRSSSLSHVTSRHRTQSSSGSGERLLCDHGGAKILKFGSERQVRRGNCLGHGARGSVVFGAQDIETGEMLAVTQWKIKSCLPRRKGSLDLSLNPELATLQKQVSSVEQELGLLQRLSHPGLVRYQAMTSEHQQGNFVISILQDFVQGVSLAMFLEEKIGLGLELLRHIARGVLDSLAFLHRNNVVHRDLRHSSVFLHQTGIVMLTDYSLDRRLGEIVLGTERVDCGLPPGLGRGGKKCDVHRLGSLLISLLQGESITEAAPSSPPGLPPEITDFLEKCLVRDEHVRWSAEQLLQHSFLTPSLDPGSGISPQRTDIRRDRRESEVSPEDSRLLLPLSGGRGGPSRVITEFEVLQWLGKGAFGDVLKVRNKLDARVYALKRIKLNPRNKALNRKITREVKLLSRLNHENVVRYYNSWIESAVMPAGEAGSESSSQITTPTPRESRPVSQHADTGLQDASVEWSVSEARPQIESDSSSDEDEEPWHAFFPGSSSSSSSIVFEGGDGGEDAVDASSPPPQTSTPELPELQFMYIQMEFCEKSTLRNVIDSGGLSDDELRLWRLFREMVEGLAHIHQQGMIHRDLKPVNVFLDLHDHVKIGDFGLATWRALHDDTKEVPSLTPLVIDQQNNSSHDLGDGILTGQVGTALYTAPELSNAAVGKAVFYNQKVDIYSLGIIFFEMCHPPWGTGMERVKTIAALRSPQITLPKDYTERDHLQQVLLLRLLLNHEPAQRPTAQELLRATPLQHEEAQLHEVLRHSLANPQSKAYKHLVSACIDQVVSPAEDMTYDLGLGKSGAPTWALRAVRSAVERIFERHGAVRLATPLLMPRSRTIPTSSVALMSHSGSVVTLPHDLRLPFARYVAWNGVTSLKRFSVERVYRERRVYGLHPRELYECAFDIVTPTPCSALGEAELLCVVWEALHEVSAHAHCVIRLNHSTLVRAVLLHCGVEEERHIEITNILSEARDGLLSRPQVQTRFRSLCLPQHTHDVLLSLLNTETPLAQATAIRALAKGRGTVASLAKEGLRHIEGVAQAAENLGVKCTILVAPGLVLDPGRYSGLLCQIACEGGRGSRAKHARRDVIAIGGTYSHLIEQFRSEMEQSCGNMGSRSGGACGISLSLERLATSLQDSDADDSTAAAADALVVALSPRALQRDAPVVARELWAAGVKTLLSDVVQGVEEAQAQSRELRAQYLVLVKDGEAVRVRSWEKDRFQERRLSATELTEWLVARRGPSSSSSTIENTEVVTNVASTAAGNPSVNFHFLTSEKLAYNTRRRYENQMTGHLASLLRNLTSRACVEVVALSADASVVRTLSSTLELAGDEDTFTSTIAVAMDKLARHRKYLGQICDKLHELRFEKSSTFILLYSLPDNVCKTLF